MAEVPRRLSLGTELLLRRGLCYQLLYFDPLQPILHLIAIPSPPSMQSWPCPVPTCGKVCRSPGGLTQHMNHKHQHHESFGKREAPIHRTYHPILDGGYNFFSVLELS